MRLSTKTRYGVRAIFDIALNARADRGQVPAAQAKDIARRESIPLRYLEQIFQDLKRAGLVESKRGPRGGYCLKRPPADITLGDVVRALQGSIDAMLALDEDSKRPVRPGAGLATSRQVTSALWQELADHVTTWFDGITIADLVKRGEALGLAQAGVDQPMYFI